MSDHIDDTKLRKLLADNGFGCRRFVLENASSATPDGYIQIDGTNFVIEYENSSRGLSCHIPKWLRVAEESNDKIVAILICSPHHVKNHKGDRLNAVCLMNRAKKDNWPVQFHILNDPSDPCALIASIKDIILKYQSS